MHLMSQALSSCEDFGNYASTPRSSCVCSAEGAGTSRLAGRFATLPLTALAHKKDQVWPPTNTDVSRMASSM
jgi:hypothetical protein